MTPRLIIVPLLIGKELIINEQMVTSSKSNIKILERFQSKVLRCLLDAPWYVKNEVLCNDVDFCSTKEQVAVTVRRYQNILDSHPNHLVEDLLNGRALRMV